MPDCSAATITLWPIPDLTTEPQDETAEEAKRCDAAEAFCGALAELDIDPDSLTPIGVGPVFDGDVFVEEVDGIRRLRVENYDAPYGINYDPFQTLRNLAPEMGYAYVAEDGGHYTWDPYSEHWHPGMAAPIERSEGQEGDTRMSPGEYNAIVAECTDDDAGGTVDYLKVGEMVAAHFALDLLAWRPEEVATA